MGDIDKGDTHLLLDLLEFDLHVLAELEVQRAQRLVQKKDLRPVHDGPGDGHPLLLAAGEGIHRALAIAGQVDQGQGFLHPLRELRLRHLGDAQAEGHVLEDIHVGEERVFLKYGVDLPFVGRNIVDAFAVKEDLAGGGLLKPADDTQCGGLTAATWTQQRQKFLVVDIEVDVIQDDVVVKLHKQVRQTDQLLCHISSPISIEF